MSNEEINDLPLACCSLPVHMINTKAAARAAADELKKEALLGFDTEKRPAFKKGQTFPPSLLQLAGANSVYIFQLKMTGLPGKLVDILADPETVKAGVAILRDIRELQDLKEFTPQGFVDLGFMAKDKGLQHHGLRGIAGVLLGHRISKGARLTNWSRTNLPDQAVKYAATDAWIGREIYKALIAK